MSFEAQEIPTLGTRFFWNQLDIVGLQWSPIVVSVIM